MGFEGTRGRQDSRAPFWPVVLTAASGSGTFQTPPGSTRHALSTDPPASPPTDQPLADPGPAVAPDRLLTVEEVAAELRVSPKWVYRASGRWPFTRKISKRVLRFDEAGFRKWLTSTRPTGPGRAIR